MCVYLCVYLCVSHVWSMPSRARHQICPLSTSVDMPWLSQGSGRLWYGVAGSLWLGSACEAGGVEPGIKCSMTPSEDSLKLWRNLWHIVVVQSACMTQLGLEKPVAHMRIGGMVNVRTIFPQCVCQFTLSYVAISSHKHHGIC